MLPFSLRFQRIRFEFNWFGFSGDGGQAAVLLQIMGRAQMAVAAAGVRHMRQGFENGGRALAHSVEGDAEHAMVVVMRFTVRSFDPLNSRVLQVVDVPAVIGSVDAGLGHFGQADIVGPAAGEAVFVGGQEIEKIPTAFRSRIYNYDNTHD